MRGLVFLSILILGNIFENSCLTAEISDYPFDPIVLINDKTTPLDINIAVESEEGEERVEIYEYDFTLEPTTSKGVTESIQSTNSMWKNETIIVKSSITDKVLCEKDFREGGNQHSSWPRIHFYKQGLNCHFE